MVSNLITLASHLHKATLKIQWFWQKKQTNIKPTMSLLITPEATNSLNATTCEDMSVVIDHPHHPDEPTRAMQSGDIFTLITNDLVNRPLPSF